MHPMYNRGSVINIDGIDYFPVEHRNGVHHIVNVMTHDPYVHTHPDGTTGPLTNAEFDRLLLSGRLRIRPARPSGSLTVLSASARSVIRQAGGIDPAFRATRQLPGRRRPNHLRATERYFRMIKDARGLPRSIR